MMKNSKKINLFMLVITLLTTAPHVAATGTFENKETAVHSPDMTSPWKNKIFQTAALVVALGGGSLLAWHLYKNSSSNSGTTPPSEKSQSSASASKKQTPNPSITSRSEIPPLTPKNSKPNDRPVAPLQGNPNSGSSVPLETTTPEAENLLALGKQLRDLAAKRPKEVLLQQLIDTIASAEIPPKDKVSIYKNVLQEAQSEQSEEERNCKYEIIRIGLELMCPKEQDNKIFQKAAPETCVVKDTFKRKEVLEQLLAASRKEDKGARNKAYLEIIQSLRANDTQPAAPTKQ